ncbi:hypothetical protein CRUP_024848 [Coryphaenoides rupestris]|nr:hypothetical protein CRUP_024848 [Coryphaenoides rupestris]
MSSLLDGDPTNATPCWPRLTPTGGRSGATWTPNPSTSPPSMSRSCRQPSLPPWTLSRRLPRPLPSPLPCRSSYPPPPLPPP